MTDAAVPRPAADVVVAASTVGLGIVLRSLAPALERVTLQQYRILVLLVLRGPMKAGDLAAELGLLPSGITRLVDRLVRAAFVERHTSRLSGREVIVTALAPAEDLVTEVLDRRRAEFRSVFRRMTKAERTAVREAAAALLRTGSSPLLDAELLLPDTAAPTAHPDAPAP